MRNVQCPVSNVQCSSGENWSLKIDHWSFQKGFDVARSGFPREARNPECQLTSWQASESGVPLFTTNPCKYIRYTPSFFVSRRHQRVPLQAIPAE